MAYQTLYRKYRPKTFELVYGQDVIVKTLKNVIKNDKLSHAYLFTGPRGTGKTSSAKLFAKAINCLNNKDGDACNECENCKSFNNNSNPDIIEIDAASNNGVDEIREIKNKVSLVPSMSKYKVYIIDEVHMLSIGAFNALLKTLEEPPEHVKFILATTEPQKLPATILSRCQRFDFKRISNEDVVKRLKIICKESNIEITDDALKIIAVLSEGAMRDAISILERCAGEQKGLIDENQVRELVGIPKTTQIYGVVKGILEYNSDAVIEETNNIIESGKDVDNFLWEIIKYIKDLLVYKSSKVANTYNEEEKKQMEELSNSVSKERLLKLIYELSELASNIKWSSQKMVMFQAGLIKACMKIETKIQNVNIEENYSKPETLNKPIQQNISKVEKPQRILNSEKKVQSANVGESLSCWDNVINKIKQSGKMGIYVNLIGSTAKEANDMLVEVNLANKNSFAKQVLEAHENKAEIEKIVSMELGKPMSVRFVSGENKTEKKQNSSSIESIANDLDVPFNIIDE